MIQGSDEWLLARCGSVGASDIADLMATTKSGPSASRKNLMFKLLAERLTGLPQETFSNAAMEHGTLTEPNARDAYCFYRDAEVVQIGLSPHPRIKGTHASPDGLVGTDGCIEIKCPNTSTHIGYIETGVIPTKYVYQMQWVMACCERSWCDFISYDPRLPEDLSIVVLRRERDETMIKELEEAVEAFLYELDEKMTRLRSKISRDQMVEETT